MAKRKLVELSDFQREMLWKLRRDNTENALKRIRQRLEFKEEVCRMSTDSLHMLLELSSEAWKKAVLWEEFLGRMARRPSRYDLIRDGFISEEPEA